MHHTYQAYNIIKVTENDRDNLSMKSDNRPVICGFAQHTFEKPINVSLDRPYSSSVL